MAPILSTSARLVKSAASYPKYAKFPHSTSVMCIANHHFHSGPAHLVSLAARSVNLKNRSKMGARAIGGIVVGVIALILLFIVIPWMIWNSRKRNTALPKVPKVDKKSEPSHREMKMPDAEREKYFEEKGIHLQTPSKSARPDE